MDGVNLSEWEKDIWLVSIQSCSSLVGVLEGFSPPSFYDSFVHLGRSFGGYGLACPLPLLGIPL